MDSSKSAFGAFFDFVHECVLKKTKVPSKTFLPKGKGGSMDWLDEIMDQDGQTLKEGMRGMLNGMILTGTKSIPDLRPYFWNPASLSDLDPSQLIKGDKIEEMINELLKKSFTL